MVALNQVAVHGMHATCAKDSTLAIHAVQITVGNRVQLFHSIMVGIVKETFSDSICVSGILNLRPWYKIHDYTYHSTCLSLQPSSAAKSVVAVRES